MKSSEGILPDHPMSDSCSEEKVEEWILEIRRKVLAVEAGTDLTEAMTKITLEDSICPKGAPSY